MEGEQERIGKKRQKEKKGKVGIGFRRAYRGTSLGHHPSIPFKPTLTL